MATRQSALFGIVLFLMQGCAHAIQPKGTPATPNYCGRFICLEVDRLSDGDTVIEAVSRKLQTDITINNKYGTTLVSVVGRSSCNPEPIIRLEENSGKYEGVGCVGSPSEAGSVQVNVRFVPVAILESKSSSPVGFPVLGIWAVDETPMSFWEKGYSLRLGAAAKFAW